MILLDYSQIALVFVCIIKGIEMSMAKWLYVPMV